MLTYVVSYIKSPVGPLTIHFWGPAANWGFVLAGICDLNKPVQKISEKMTATLLCYSAVFMRFAWRVAPRNYMLFLCHLCNFSCQGLVLGKKFTWNRTQKLQQQQLT